MSNLGDVINAIELEAFKRVAEAERMTEQEAIKQMDDMIAHAEDMFKDGANEVWKKDIEALTIGKNATEKQLAQKPVLKLREKSVEFVEYIDGSRGSEEKIENNYCCPQCLKKLTKALTITNKHIPSKRVRYCNHCGQKILWS